MVEIALEKVPKYELLAPRFKQLRASGASVESIASAHGMCRAYAEQILKFAETGERPQWKSGKRTGTGNRVEYIDNSQQVVENARFAEVVLRTDRHQFRYRRRYGSSRVRLRPSRTRPRGG